MPDASSAEPDAPLRPSLFRLGAEDSGERTPWGQALMLALLVHAASAGAWILSPARTLPPPPPEEPELVFLAYHPPPAAAARAPGPPLLVPPRAPVRPPPHAALLRPRPVERLVEPTLPPKPVAPPEPSPEPPPAPSVSEEPAASDTGAPAGEEAVGGVIGGLVGGALRDGLEGTSGTQALELNQVSREPRVLERVAPHYPKRVRAEGIEGLVRVRFIVGVDGRVEPEHTQVLQSVPALDAAAIAAVNQWRFTPALGSRGQPVRVIVELPFEFSLK